MPPLGRLITAGLIATSTLTRTVTSQNSYLPRFVTGREDSQAGRVQINRDFPDPTIIQGDDGDWYSFATNSGGVNVQAARAPDPLGPWTYLDVDAMPVANWTTGHNTWAPDVRRVEDGSYVLYFSGELPEESGKHCVGVATSTNVLGPYDAQPEPWTCDLERGGAIDPAGYLDLESGRRYVVYKVDGNHVGNGGDCGNGVEPLVGTPIMLQEVEEDGFTKVGDAREILDRTDEDGPLVEAPNVIRLDDGTYVLFFSSFCFDSEKYNVNYATSSELTGPYVRAEKPLLETGDFGLEGPGGATSTDDGGYLVFHGRCNNGRCMYATRYRIIGDRAVVSRF